MRASVALNFITFNTPLEGMLDYMYTDAKGLVTTGMGNLIDPVGAALALPWRRRADDAMATPSEVQDEWQRVKDAFPGVTSAATRSITTLYLSKDDINNLIVSKAQQFENTMRGVLTNYDNAPADAQMGALSMAWAMGPGFVNTFKQFAAAFNADDYVGAGAQATFKGVGIQPRLNADQVLFQNAAAVAQAGGDRDILYWPRSITIADVQPPGSFGGPSGGGIAKTLGILGGLVAVAGTGAYFLLRGRA